MLTSRQISEWEAYDRLDPIGEWREDFRFAQLMSLLVNIVSRIFAKKGQTIKDVSPMDFMPDWVGVATNENVSAQKVQSVEEMKSILLGIAKVQNKVSGIGKNTKKRKPIKKNKDGL